MIISNQFYYYYSSQILDQIEVSLMDNRSLDLNKFAIATRHCTIIYMLVYSWTPDVCLVVCESWTKEINVSVRPLNGLFDNYDSKKCDTSVAFFFKDEIRRKLPCEWKNLKLGLCLKHNILHISIFTYLKLICQGFVFVFVTIADSSVVIISVSFVCCELVQLNNLFCSKCDEMAHTAQS